MRFNNFLAITSALLLSQPVWAGDDDIAYLRDSDGVWQVWLFDIQNQTHEQLTQGEVDKTRVSWNQDRTKLLINRNDGSVAWLELETSTQSSKGTGDESTKPARKITDLKLPVKGILDAKLSNDDQWIAYSDVIYKTKPNYNIWRVKVDGSASDQLTNQSDLQNFPSWSSDDTKLVYLSGTSTSGRHVWQLDVKSKSQEQLTSNVGYSFDPTLNQNGDLVYSSNETGNYDLWLKKQGTKDAVRLTSGSELEGAPSWSPDGSQLVYEVLSSSNRQLWIMNIDGSKKTLITPKDTSSRSPAWAK